MTRLATTLTLASAAAALAVGVSNAAPPSSLAALGDSVSIGFASAGRFQPAPANSWITGGNPLVRSVYRRLLASDPSLAQHVTNDAMAGATMSQLAYQVGLLPSGVDLVTIEMGTNDVCEGTTAAAFRSELDDGLDALDHTQPQARVVVLSIFDLPAMWSRVKSSPRAVARRNYCIGATTSTGRARFERTLLSFDRVLAAACSRHPHCSYDQGAAAHIAWQRTDVSTVDFFHPSVSGQRKIAAALWATGLFGAG